MAKEDRSIRTGSKDIQGITGKEAEADSRQTGERSDGIWINEQGEVCIGNKCFSLRVKPDGSEVRIKIDRNECGTDLQPVIDEIYQALGKGAPTVYETASKIEESK